MENVTVSASSSKFIHEGKDCDFDRYTITKRTPLSTHEISVVVDHINEEITGDVIRYGGWHDLDADELTEALDIISKENAALRPFGSYTKKG